MAKSKMIKIYEDSKTDSLFIRATIIKEVDSFLEMQNMKKL